jgi:hypothetical protein
MMREIYYFNESSMFTDANTASWISEIVQKLQLEHVDHINDGFLPWNYIMPHLSVFGLLAVLVWRALYPRRFAVVSAWLFAAVCAVWMNGISRFSREERRLCPML